VRRQAQPRRKLVLQQRRKIAAAVRERQARHLPAKWNRMIHVPWRGVGNCGSDREALDVSQCAAAASTGRRLGEMMCGGSGSKKTVYGSVEVHAQPGRQRALPHCPSG